MKITGKPFDPIRRTYDVIKVLHSTNKTNEELLKEFMEKYPNTHIIKIKKLQTKNNPKH